MAPSENATPQRDRNRRKHQRTRATRNTEHTEWTVGLWEQGASASRGRANYTTTTTTTTTTECGRGDRKITGRGHRDGSLFVNDRRGDMGPISESEIGTIPEEKKNIFEI